jgi:biotin operon repressor
MFYQKMLEVLALDRALNTTDIVMFCFIANFMDNEGKNSFPSTNVLAFKLRVSRRAVQKSISRLVATGYIEAVHRKRQVSVYNLGPKLRPLLQANDRRTLETG